MFVLALRNHFPFSIIFLFYLPFYFLNSDGIIPREINRVVMVHFVVIFDAVTVEAYLNSLQFPVTLFRTGVATAAVPAMNKIMKIM